MKEKTSEVSTSESSPPSYMIPVKRILSPAHLKAFQESQTHKEIVEFIEELNASVNGVKLSEAGEGSPAVHAILRLLDSIEAIALSTPATPNPLSRFGNPAFRTFYDLLSSQSAELHLNYLGPSPSSVLSESIEQQSRCIEEQETMELKGTLPESAIPEISIYLQESFGNRERIDYGSGMELNFLCWLLCLKKLGLLNKADGRCLVLKVFWRYIQIMRILQQTYWLEPAGSHGVWGLDDYHFLPFLFGSSQLNGHKHLRPKSIHDKEIMELFKDEYMYLGCVNFVNEIKTESLRWHSPMLDDISAVKTWSKVNSGMIKMYLAEVLNKLPVVQHFFFGSLLPFPEGAISEEEEKKAVEEVDEHGHVHLKRGEGWAMDCCGIPVPSAFAAAAALDPEGGGGNAATGLLKPRGGLRPIPFD